MIIRDSTTPRGRIVELPSESSPLENIHHHLYPLPPGVNSWKDRNAMTWLQRERRRAEQEKQETP